MGSHFQACHPAPSLPEVGTLSRGKYGMESSLPCSMGFPPNITLTVLVYTSLGTRRRTQTVGDTHTHHSQIVSRELAKEMLKKGLCGQIHPFLSSLHLPPHTIRDLPESRAAWEEKAFFFNLGCGGQGFLFLLVVWLCSPGPPCQGQVRRRGSLGGTIKKMF